LKGRPADFAKELVLPILFTLIYYFFVKESVFQAIWVFSTACAMSMSLACAAMLLFTGFDKNLVRKGLIYLALTVGLFLAMPYVKDLP
jgi:hypothetical protein